VRGRRGTTRKQLLGDLKEETRNCKLKTGSTRSHPVENQLWKKLWTCRKTDNRFPYPSAAHAIRYLCTHSSYAAFTFINYFRVSTVGIMLSSEKSIRQSYPFTGPDRPLGLQEVETPTLLEHPQTGVARLPALRTGMFCVGVRIICQLLIVHGVNGIRKT
jgi:hypothetical protein